MKAGKTLHLADLVPVQTQALDKNTEEENICSMFPCFVSFVFFQLLIPFYSNKV